MPNWVDTPEEEKAWKKAKKIVQEQRDKKESEFSSRDWGLVSHIAKNILKSSVLAAATDNGLIYRLAKVDHILRARTVRAKKDDNLPEDAKSVVEALKKVMSFGGQSIAKLRDLKSTGMDDEEAEAFAEELTEIADRLKDMLDGLK